MLQRYYVQYLKGYDQAELEQVMAGVHVKGNDELVILSSVSQLLADLSISQLESGSDFDFNGLRLDWIRLQVSTITTD